MGQHHAEATANDAMCGRYVRHGTRHIHNVQYVTACFTSPGGEYAFEKCE